jgi:hypothetical protein
MNMRFIISLFLLISLAACHNSDDPDVSDIRVDLKTYRFEKDLFALDTNNLQASLSRLRNKYPTFADNFFTTILNTDPTWPADRSAQYINGFLGSYKKVYDTTEKVFPNFDSYEKKLEKAVQYLLYYFPDYKAPKNIITYIGPLDGFGDILTEDAFIVGLHHHLGDFSLYKSMLVHETYPDYISRRFEPSYIPVNAMKNIVLDMFPEKFEDKTLILQMVEKGKRLYMLSKLLPGTEEYKLIGYTEEQLKESYTNERYIWDLFVQNNLLQTTDNNSIKNYIGESPKTMELGERSPGNIGSFSGWQIVKKYMSKNKELPLKDLMIKDPEEIFREAKYKP